MQFALIGYDDQSQILLRDAASSARHAIVAVCDAPQDVYQYLGSEVKNVPAALWESFMASGDVDAVILATGPDPALREEQIKRFIQSGVPLLLVHPACDVMFAYEAEMMRREAGGIVIPFVADWWHPAFDRLMEWVKSGSDHGREGSIQQIIWERKLSEHTQPSVLRHFGRDVEIIRRMLGQISSVSAVGVSNDESSLAAMTVHCTGEPNASARWSVMPAGIDTGSQVTVVAAAGTAILHMDSGERPWTVEFRGVEHISESFPGWNAGERALDRMQAASLGEATAPSWLDACLDLEALDSVQKSLRRKRAVDVHTGEASEDQTFKGFMASAGCLILVAVLLVFISLAVFEGFRLPLREEMRQTDPQQAEGARWPLWLRLWPVYPLVVFLLLQFFLLLAKRPPPKKAERAPERQ